MSASAGLRQRLMTSLLMRCPMTSNAPLAGNILILRSAYSAMPCPQIPPALTTNGAKNLRFTRFL